MRIMKFVLGVAAALGFATTASTAATLTFGDGGYLANPNGYTEAGMVLSGAPNGIQNWQNATTTGNGTGEREMLFRQTISFSTGRCPAAR